TPLSPHSSFESTVSLGKEKGYQLIGMIGNLFFVRNDIVEKLNLPSAELIDSSSLFDPSWLEQSQTKTILSSLKSKFKRMLKI
ncbi:MAG: hypothetical protein ACKO86_30480, partial [Dolichospermum sp.]